MQYNDVTTNPIWRKDALLEYSFVSISQPQILGFEEI